MDTRNERKQARKDPAERRYFSARVCLMICVGVTALNLLSALLGGSLFIFFSLSVPYYVILFLPPAFALFVGAAVLVFFLLCAYFSGKNTRWMTAALIGFCVDTVFFGFTVWLLASGGLLPLTSFILEAAAHVWILAYLIIGTVNAKKVRELQKEKKPENVLPESAFFTNKRKK